MYTVGGGDAKLFLKRRLFRTPQKIPTDPVEYHLIYSQAVHSVLHGDFPLNDQAALRLAGLKAQVDWGDYDAAQTGRLNNLANFLPASFIPLRSKDEWVKEIAAIHSKLTGKSALQAKVLYLEAVKQFPMYGATFFPAVYKGFWQHSNNVMIAVHVDGIAWLHQKTKAILKMYSYERVINWELDDKFVAFNLKAEPGEPDTETHRVEFTCDEAEEVVAQFNERFGDLRPEIERYLQQYQDDPSFFQFLKNVREGHANLPNRLRPVVESAFSDRTLLRNIEYVTQLESEERRHNGMPAAFRNSSVGARIIQDISVAKSFAIENAGTLARGRYTRSVEELGDLQNQATAILIEILNARRGQLSQEMQQQQVNADVARSNRVTADEEHYLWPFNGEYWRDELGFYRQQVVSRCGR